MICFYTQCNVTNKNIITELKKDLYIYIFTINLLLKITDISIVLNDSFTIGKPIKK